MVNPLTVPSLRGQIGDWIYYSGVLSMREVAARVSFADEIHTNTDLSSLIQRALSGARAAKIAKYLVTENERFFNSLVVAVYGDKPQWAELGEIRPSRGVTLEALGLKDQESFPLGFLRFSGREKMFAVDGQHRLAGMRELARVAAKGSKVAEERLDEVVSLLFVAHQATNAGRIRSRRLFTTLNKTAIPVNKYETIALDENDAMAIVCRRLIEDHREFTKPRIAVKSAPNIVVQQDTSSLTTIVNLYDVLGSVLRVCW